MNVWPSFDINKTEYENNPLITQKTYFSNKISYIRLQYDKAKVEELHPLEPNVLVSGKYRSVFLNPDTEEIVCFSPPKSTPVSIFIHKYPKLDTSIVTETIEGTMVTLFYDGLLNHWEICTKSAVGGKYFYYRTEYNNETNNQLSFRTMFCEAMGVKELDEIPSSDRFLSVRSYCFTFILQHPENHMVLPVKKPKAYLVALHNFNPDGHSVTPVMQDVFEKWDFFQNAGIKVYYPKIYAIHDYDEMNELFYQMTARYDNMGFMITNKQTGDRTTIRNPKYDYVRALRGNNPNLQYQYLEVMKEDKIKEFLSYFPMYKKQFRVFYDSWQECVTQIHNSYVSFYVFKTGKRIAKKYMQFICRLHHEVYILSKMGEEGTTIIKRNVVNDFMQTYETGRLFHLMQILHEPYISEPAPKEPVEPTPEPAEPTQEPAEPTQEPAEPTPEPESDETESEYVRVPPCVTV